MFIFTVGHTKKSEIGPTWEELKTLKIKLCVIHHQVMAKIILRDKWRVMTQTEPSFASKQTVKNDSGLSEVSLTIKVNGPKIRLILRTVHFRR